MDFLQNLCTRLVVLELGHVIAQGPPAEVLPTRRLSTPTSERWPIMLELAGLQVTYGTTVAVASLELSVSDNGATALLGANGAGKTRPCAPFRG